MYHLRITPANTRFNPHIWKEGGELTMKQAKHYKKQLEKVRSLYDYRKRFYSKVEIVTV